MNKKLFWLFVLVLILGAVVFRSELSGYVANLGVTAPDGKKVYTDKTLGVTFSYPKDLKVEEVTVVKTKALKVYKVHGAEGDTRAVQVSVYQNAKGTWDALETDITKNSGRVIEQSKVLFVHQADTAKGAYFSTLKRTGEDVNAKIFLGEAMGANQALLNDILGSATVVAK